MNGQSMVVNVINMKFKFFSFFLFEYMKNLSVFTVRFHF